MQPTRSTKIFSKLLHFCNHVYCGINGYAYYTLITCLEINESKIALQDVHAGICGSDSTSFSLAKKTP